MEETMYEQMSIFDSVQIDKVITKPVRLISFFSGIESQFKALSFLSKELNIPVESYKTCEWAYNSIIACNAIHNKDFTDYSANKTKEELLSYLQGNISVDYNQPADLKKKPESWLRKCYNACIANHNLMNIMNVHGKDLEIEDNNKHEYICTYSFPCQDLSLAGLRKGMDVSQAEGGTRSGLLWEFERIITECKELGYNHMPQILIMENVPQIHSEKDMPNFRKWMLRLEELGYTNYWQDLNAKDYGIPQNRDRCFMISILRNQNGTEYSYKFPVKFQRELKLKDMLETTVDEKYYLSQKMIDYLTGINQKESKYDRGAVFERNLNPNKDCAATITTAAGQRPTDNFVVDDIKVVGNYMPSGHNAGRVVDPNGLAPTVMENHGTVTAIVEEEYDGTFDYAQSDKLRPTKESRYHKDNEVSGTILASGNQNGITVKIREATKQGYKEAHEGDGVNISGRMHNQRGNVQDGMAQTLKTSCDVGVVVKGESMFTETEKQLFTEDGNVRRYIGSEQIDKLEEGGMATTTFPNGYGHGSRTHRDESVTLNTVDRPVVKQNFRIRKLTPKEAMRLMAFQDVDVDNMYNVGLTDSAIFHCAGDSIVSTVLMGIIGKLFGLSNVECKNIIKKYISTIKS